jgi:aryl-alcohol dehydrogenase-like predicted oxidoreductase
LEYRKLGNLEVSAIGLGTLRTFDVTSDEDITVRQRIVDNCLDNQVNLIDTAAWYGHAEQVVGVTTQDKRDQFYLATKVRCEGKEAGQAQIAKSFELLNTDYIELFQVHNLVDWQTHLPTLQDLKEEGKIGMVGVTAMVHEAYPVIMDLMKTGRVDAVQIPYSVMERGCEAELLPLAEELGVGILVMEPLSKGRYIRDLKSQPDLAPLAEYDIQTWAQALLAWVLGDTRISAAIPATSQPSRVQENAHAGSVGPLPQEMRDYIRQEAERCL